MSQRPDYVENFDKPPKTEIKKISGHWYLYSYKVVYDEIKKKKVKKSGDSLGAITPEGLVPSKKYTPVVHHELDATAELGATYYFYSISQKIKENLKKFFPDMWEKNLYYCYFKTSIRWNIQKIKNALREQYNLYNISKYCF